MYKAFTSECMQTLSPQRCWSLVHVANARLHRHTCEVVSDKASKLSTQAQSSKYCRWLLKQNKAMQYHLHVMVLDEYSSCYVLSVCLSYDFILTLLKLSNISKPLFSSLTLAPQCLVLIVLTWYVMAAKPYRHMLTNYFYLRTQYVASLSKLFYEVCAFSTSKLSAIP